MNKGACRDCLKNNNWKKGTTVYLCKGLRSSIDPAEVVRLRRKWTVGEIAEKLGVSDRRIYQVLQMRKETQ